MKGEYISFRSLNFNFILAQYTTHTIIYYKMYSRLQTTTKNIYVVWNKIYYEYIDFSFYKKFIELISFYFYLLLFYIFILPVILLRHFCITQVKYTEYTSGLAFILFCCQTKSFSVIYIF